MTKQKIILFEGPDKCGKTTIAKELSKFIDIPYFKFTAHDYWDKSEYELATKFDQPFLAELLRQTGQSIIIDRGYPSEYVYGSAYNRNPDLDLIAKLDNMFAKLNTTIVFCYKRKHNEVDEKVNVSKYATLRNLYQSFMLVTKCNGVLLDTTDQDLNKQIKTITERLKEIYGET